MQPYRPLVSFCIPHYGDNALLKRCIHSIKEQDYKNHEIIVVLDGKNEEASAMLAELKKDIDCLHYFEQENQGAPSARNRAFAESKGELISFFDSDCVLLPGSLRTWMQYFEDNPDIDFVYGDYRINTQSYDIYKSKEFDPYLLQTNNYIASMFPLKREKVVKWTEGLKGLQDWDYWLQVVKNGSKGKYIKDITILTEPSYKWDKSSISTQTDDNWLDRVKTIKARHNIPMRPICVSSLGAEFQAIYRAKVLDADYKQMPSEKPHEYKMILLQGFYPYAGPAHRMVFANAPQDCLKVINWIGTDVFQLRELKFNQTKQFVKALNQNIDHHFCNCPWLRQELLECGINAETVYQPMDLSDYNIAPLPEEPTVGIYFTESNPMHNIEFLIDVASAMPDIRFKFFGGFVEMPAEKNVQYVGRIKNMPEFIKTCTMNVRVTVHDGFPMTPVQFAMMGRQCITNSDMPYMHRYSEEISDRNYLNAKAVLINMIRAVIKMKRPEKELNELRAHYKKLLDPDHYKSVMYDVLEKGRAWKPIPKIMVKNNGNEEVSLGELSNKSNAST